VTKSWPPDEIRRFDGTENEMNMKGQQKKEKGKIYINSIRREGKIDEKEMLQNVSTKQINKEWLNERQRRLRKKKNCRKYEEEDNCGQKEDIEGARRRKSFVS
jgi:hypothetical protein